MSHLSSLSSSSSPLFDSSPSSTSSSPSQPSATFYCFIILAPCFFSYLDSLKHFFCCQSSADHTMRFTANSVSFSSPPEELSSPPLNHEQPQSQSLDVTQPPPPPPLPPKKNYSLIYENTKNTTLYAVAEIC